MEPIRKIIHPRTTGPVDLQLILNPTVNIKVKLQLVQKIYDGIEVKKTFLFNTIGYTIKAMIL